jgi:membrane-associated phospholipid phosphatase
LFKKSLGEVLNKLVLPIIAGIMLQTNTFAMDTEQAGDILQIIIPTVAYGTTLYLDDREGQNQFYKSFGTNLSVTYGLKYSINKKRPNGGKHSFPSGHTSAAFQGTSFIHKRYGLKYAVPTYLAATFVGYSRVDSDAHYTEDVIAGAVIGTLSSFYFTTEYNGFEIKPIAMNGGYGIVFKITW